jgi:hypothetical protein
MVRSGFIQQEVDQAQNEKRSPAYHSSPVTNLSAFQHTPRTNQWVFPGLRGQAWSLAGIEKVWGRVRRKCGLDDVRLHDLRRRTTASR